MPQEAAPAVWAPWFLLTSIGPLFFIVSPSAPLMQRWYALEPPAATLIPSTPPRTSAASPASFRIRCSSSRCGRATQLALWSAGYALLG